jgi:hypothetical protein
MSILVRSVEPMPELRRQYYAKVVHLATDHLTSGHETPKILKLWST